MITPRLKLLSCKLALIYLATLITACSHLDVYKVHDSFKGIQGMYNSDQTVNILIVHGMGEHYPEYSAGMQAQIAKQLGFLNPGNEIGRNSIKINQYPIGTVIRTRFHNSIDEKSKNLNIVELTWSQATMPIKTLLLDLDPDNKYKERGFLESKRLMLNSIGKSFVNTHLSDPILYAGSFGPTIRTAVSQAICIMFSNPPPVPELSDMPCKFEQASRTSGEIVIISSSLGSTLVFDTAVELFNRGGHEQRVADKFIDGTKRIYMFANQLPLLGLKELDAITGPDWLDNYPCPTPVSSLNEASGEQKVKLDGLRAFLSLKQRHEGSDEALDESLSLDIVSFNDPNDLLTYAITDRFKRHCGPANFANVTVTNAETGWLFIAADPKKAHTYFDKNDRVIELLVKGHTVQ